MLLKFRFKGNFYYEPEKQNYEISLNDGKWLPSRSYKCQTFYKKLFSLREVWISSEEGIPGWNRCDNTLATDHLTMYNNHKANQEHYHVGVSFKTLETFGWYPDGGRYGGSWRFPGMEVANQLYGITGEVIIPYTMNRDGSLSYPEDLELYLKDLLLKEEAKKKVSV
jgi:hypothetical protein